MPTVLEFFSDAIADVGGADPGQTPGGSRIQFARRKFAEMIRNWSTNRLRLFYIPEVVYVLQNGQGAYTIGPGAADFDTDPGVYVKPVFIQAARVIVGNARRYPLNILTRPEWDVNQSRTLLDPDGPIDFFYDFASPIGTFNVAPKPGGVGWLAGQQLLISQWNPLKIFNQGDEALNVEDFYPQEYLKPMRLGLSIELAPVYNKQIGQEIAASYQQGVQFIENTNNEKLSGAYGTSRTLDGPLKGEGSPVQAPRQ